MKTINLLPTAPRQWARLLVYQRRLVPIAVVTLIFFIPVVVCLIIFEQFVLAPQELTTKQQFADLKTVIDNYKDRQAVLVTIQRKLNVVAPVINNRFPYDQILSEIEAILPSSVRLLNFSINADGLLTFVVQAAGYKSIDQLIQMLVSREFSRSFIYTLENTSRDNSGAYTLKFKFSAKQ